MTAHSGSGTSGGHAWSAPVMRGPGADFRVIARAVQGMARVRSGQAPAWPLVSDRSARRDTPVSSVTSRCTFTRRFSPVLVAWRSQSRLMLEGRARTLSGPSPDLSQATTPPPSGRREDLCSGSCWRCVPAAGLRPDRPGCHTGRVHQRRGISRKYAADSIPGGAGRACFCQHLACQAWVVAAGGQPRKGEEQGYSERFRHCSIYGC